MLTWRTALVFRTIELGYYAPLIISKILCCSDKVNKHRNIKAFSWSVSSIYGVITENAKQTGAFSQIVIKRGPMFDMTLKMFGI